VWDAEGVRMIQQGSRRGGDEGIWEVKNGTPKVAGDARAWYT